MKKALIFLTAFLCVTSTVTDVLAAVNWSNSKPVSLSLKKRQKAERQSTRQKASSRKTEKNSVTETSQPVEAVEEKNVPEKKETPAKKEETTKASAPAPSQNKVLFNNTSTFNNDYDENRNYQKRVRAPTDAVRKENKKVEETSVAPVVLTPDEKLFEAVSQKKLTDIRQALEEGANLNARQDGRFVLNEAFLSGDDTVVLYLLSRGADVGVLDDQGRNLYYTAFSTINKPSVVKALLDKKLSVDTKDFNNVPMLFYAFAVSRDPEIISLLIKEGNADVNIVDGKGDTALLFLIKENYPDRLIETLLSFKPNVNLTDKDGDTALLRALRQSDFELAKKLVDAGADVNYANKKGMTPLRYALSKVRAADVLEKMITKKTNVNVVGQYGETPLMYTLKRARGNEKAVELLLDAGADVNVKDKDGDTPLMYLTREIQQKDLIDSDYLVELLIDAGASLNERDRFGKTPLMYMAMSKYVAVLDDVSLIQMMLDSGAKTEVEDFDGNTVLIQAVKNTSSVPLIKALLDAGADIHHMDASAKTALDYAKGNLRLSLKEGYNDILKRLTTNEKEVLEDFFKFLKIGNFTQIQRFISQGAPLNTGDENGDTALLKAIMYSRAPEIIEYMIDNGADVNAKNNDGDTPLMKAFIHNHDLEIVTLLLKNGADVNAQNNKGETPLRRAVLFSENPMIVELLIKSGADADMADVDGQTIWDVAEKNSEVKEKDTYKKLVELTDRQ